MNPRDAARRDVCEHARRMWREGLVTGSAGNVSRRVGGDASSIAITPTSVPYDVLTEEQVVIVDVATGNTIDSSHQPSYELPMHLGIYRERPDIEAIVHTHAPHVAALSVLHKSLPPVIDEMMLYFGGEVAVTEYAFTGTAEVGINVLRALGDRAGVILANHGNVCIGRTLGRALHAAISMEACARIYMLALQCGTPVRLPDDAIALGRALYDERSK